MACCYIGLLVLGAFLALTYALLKYVFVTKVSPLNLQGSHVLITGGSKGIGKALALEATRRGANVTIVARNQDTLRDTCDQLKQICDINSVSTGKPQKAQWLSTDVTGGFEECGSMVETAEQNLGPVDVLINNAGGSKQAAFAELPEDTFESQMRLNYLSAIYTTRAVLPGMKARKNGRIVFVSSAAGQIGIWGYSAYSAAKFALRGLAEALQMELTPFGIRVTVVYPPNTATEGFQAEIKTMPKEVHLISETAGLFDPKDVARKTIDDTIKGNYSCSFGMDGWMLQTLTAGAAPETHPVRALQQVLLAGLLRLVILGYQKSFDKIVLNCKLEKENKKSE